MKELKKQGEKKVHIGQPVDHNWNMDLEEKEEKEDESEDNFEEDFEQLDESDH